MGNVRLTLSHHALPLDNRFTNSFEDGTLQNWQARNSTNLSNNAGQLQIISSGAGGVKRIEHLQANTDYTLRFKLRQGTAQNIALTVRNQNTLQKYLNTFVSDSSNEYRFSTSTAAPTLITLYIPAGQAAPGSQFHIDDLQVTETLETESAADYYPFGWTMPGRSYTAGTKPRYGYQGEYAEQDPETGWNHFPLRQYDPRMGRWMVPDPYGQYFSPYLAMGNNPISFIDPDGGLSAAYQNWDSFYESYQFFNDNFAVYRYGDEYWTPFDDPVLRKEIQYLYQERYGKNVNVDYYFSQGAWGYWEDSPMRTQYNQCIDYCSGSNTYSGFAAGVVSSFTAIDEDILLFNRERIASVSDLYPNRDPYDGFWGNLEYFWTGGYEDGLRYNKQGAPIGYAPSMGVPPIPSIGKIGGAVKTVKSIRGILKSLKLPVKGKIRFIPRKNWTSSQPLTKGANGGYLDKFGNEWVWPKGLTQGQKHWDVILSARGKAMLGKFSKSGNHINVTQGGKIHH